MSGVDIEDLVAFEARPILGASLTNLNGLASSEFDDFAYPLILCEVGQFTAKKLVDFTLEVGSGLEKKNVKDVGPLIDAILEVGPTSLDDNLEDGLSNLPNWEV